MMVNLPLIEILALNSLYNSTDGEYWIWHHPYDFFGYPWNFTKNIDGNYQYDPCSKLHVWQGIECEEYDNENHISSLTLPSHNLQGTLPKTLSYLNNLVKLNVSINHLSGTIPIEYNNFTQLETLIIYSNHFTGPFPEFLLGLSQLNFIDCILNYFT
eukprot:gene20020-28341_t